MRSIYFIFFFFWMILANEALGQCSQDITLSSQEEIDNFAVDYGCIAVEGDVFINGEDITNLLGLETITSIAGDLWIDSCSALTNIDGFNAILSINGNIYINNNDALISIDGFNALTSVKNIEIVEHNALTNINGFNSLLTIGGNLMIGGLEEGNLSLTDINGFSSLTSIEANCRIYYNPVLTNLNGLSELTSVGHDLLINRNDALTNLDDFNALTSVGINCLIGGLEDGNNALVSLEGLSSLSSIGERLRISHNIALTNLDGLNSISSLQEYLVIIDNISLVNLDGLNSLTSIEEGLVIRNNTTLPNVDGLSSLFFVGGEVVVENNSALTNLDGLNSLLFVEGNIGIYSNENLNTCCIIASFPTNSSFGGNAVGCNTLWESISNCDRFRISAQAFYDTNENGTFDTEEQFLYNLPFTIDPAASYTFENGSFDFYVEDGTYTIQYDEESNSLWQITGVDSYTIEVSDDTDTIFYFPLLPVTDFLIQEVDVTSSITRCNQETNVWLTYTNQSSEPTNGYVSLLADELTTFIASTPPVDSIAGDTLYWFYENLYSTYSEQIHAIFEMPGVGNDGENVGIPITFDAEMQTWEGNGEAKFGYNSELVCAYDPNDKLVTPMGVGEENYTLFEDSLLTYTIRFQNTGNDTAFSVLIRDQIQENLDIETFQFIASSHEVSTKINESVRIVEFQFDDIYLPDSNVNEPASHGFVKFTIETNSNLAENTSVENTAHIFFDFNPAIVTNTTQNLMVSEFPMTSIASIIEDPMFRIYPNPNTGSFMIDNSHQTIQEIKIFDIAGRLIESQKADNTQVQMNINVKAGIYLVSLVTQEGTFVKKIMVQ